MIEKSPNKKRTLSQDKYFIKPSIPLPSPKFLLSEEYDKRESNKIKLTSNQIVSEVLSKKEALNLKTFEIEVSKLNFHPIGSNANYPGNYDVYLETTLSHISKLRNIKFNYALESCSNFENFPKNIFEHLSLSNKKILALDLDETLIHADFDKNFNNKKNFKYECKNFFYSEENCEKREKSQKNEKDEDDKSILIEEDSKDLTNSKILNTVGIFIRPGVKQFLEEVNKYFEVGIFTASVPEYADAVINYLEPENIIIKFRLYRNNCIEVKNFFRVKNLKIFKNIPLEKIILLDNNMYSFAAQLNNGILINSFIYDKRDNELSNVLRYLLNFILPAEDVRKVNEQFFGFKKILDKMILNGF